MESSKLTKAEIIDDIYEKVDVNKKIVHQIIDELFNEIKQALENDRSVELRGFGTFEIRTRRKREKARNPRTGELVSVGAHGVAVFRPGKELKQSVWSLRK